MYQTEEKIRVRYSETDKMGYCYYGNYAAYFEVARVEALRKLGISYRKMEDDGILLPVVSFTINYKAPAYYDDEVVIKTQIRTMPTAKIVFSYDSYVGDKLINQAETTLVFLDAEKNKPVLAPDYITNSLKPYLSN